MRVFTYSYLQQESLQEPLGFSPFEIVFGHTVRGPLKLFKVKFLSDNVDSLNLLQYVSDFRTKLPRACELARANLVSAQKSMKARYDLDSVERKFEPGQKVLALLPVPGSPLQATFFGPYVVEKKLRVIVSKNQRNGGHGQKIDFAHTL